MADKTQVLEARKAVDAYRAAHAQIYTNAITTAAKAARPRAHTPLLATMMAVLEKQGFNSLDEFFAANETFEDTVIPDVYQRIGECNHCGKCCEGCKSYKGSGICAIYNIRPEMCKTYPIVKAILQKAVPPECSFTAKANDRVSPDLLSLNLGWH